LHLYRIIQELLNNILKHAEASVVSVTIEKQANQIYISIRDNGKGFNFQDKLKTSKSLGLKSLVERCNIINALIDVKLVENKGSETIIELPFVD